MTIRSLSMQGPQAFGQFQYPTPPLHLTSADLENVLQHVWVAGPGTAQPGEPLTNDTTPLTREQAQALPGPRHRPRPPQHPRRGRLLHLPARRQRRCLPLEHGLPQLRQVRPLRR